MGASNAELCQILNMHAGLGQHLWHLCSFLFATSTHGGFGTFVLYFHTNLLMSFLLVRNFWKSLTFDFDCQREWTDTDFVTLSISIHLIRVYEKLDHFFLVLLLLIRIFLYKACILWKSTLMLKICTQLLSIIVQLNRWCLKYGKNKKTPSLPVKTIIWIPIIFLS